MSDITHNGRFQVVKKLADTLQGHIHLARDLQKRGEFVVLKETKVDLVKRGLTHDGHPVHEDFMEEKRLMKVLSGQPNADPGFVRLLLDWDTRRNYYYSMEYCEAPLFQYISNAFMQNGKMYAEVAAARTQPQEALRSNDAHQWLIDVRSMFRQLVKAMYWMHNQGVVHLDISLENTMIYKVKGLEVKIIDFGLAKQFDYRNPNKPKDALFRNDKRVGKRGYMAPEVFNSMVYDCRKADIWSLGVMLFMMSTGAPPYKRATSRDPTFNYIVNGMLESVLKHWKRLPLISKDCLDCMKKIFKWEKDRITMEELIKHPFVDLEGEIMAQSLDTEHAFDRIQGFLTHYHVKYALPSHLGQLHPNQSDKANDSNGTKGQPLISIQTEMADPDAEKALPKFGEDCKEITRRGPKGLLDDLQHILQNINTRNGVQPTSTVTNTGSKGLSMDKATIDQAAATDAQGTLSPVNKRPKDDTTLSPNVPKLDTDSETVDSISGIESNNTSEKPKVLGTENNPNSDEVQQFAAVYRNLVDGLKGQPFIQSQNSMILRRCFRNREECEASNELLIEVYGRENDAVFNDAKQRMSMQIMDRIYCYFAYAHDLGFAFRDDEMEEIEKALKGGDDQKEEAESMDRALLKVKGLLKMKKMQMAKTKYGKQVHEVMARRKIKFCSSSLNFMVEEATKGRHDPQSLSPGITVVRFAGIKSKMQEYLSQIKVKWDNVPSMSMAELLLCLKRLQKDVYKAEKHALKKMKPDHWKAAQVAFKSNGISEKQFDKLKKKQFVNMMAKKIPAGISQNLRKHLKIQLEEIAKKRFSVKNDSISECTAEEVAGLLLETLKNLMKMDIENDVDIELLKGIFVANSIDGKAFMAMDEEYVVSNLLMRALKERFGNLDAHRLGKRYRYWPEYKENAMFDLYNGQSIKNWYVKPKYGNIKEEALENPLAKISVIQWNHLVLYAQTLIKTAAFMALKAAVPVNKKEFGATSNSAINKYGVKSGDTIRLEQLVPLLAYINLDFVSKEVVRSCNNNNWRHEDKEGISNVIQQHANLAHTSRLIRETVECYGQRWGKETDRKIPTFYHLLDKDIVPSSLDLRFFSPMSVTTNLNAALVMNDFNENEVVLQLKHSPNSNLRYFDCSWISDYPLESELIVCGGLGTATICNIYDLCAGMRFDYHVMAMDLFIAAISRMPIRTLDENSMYKVAAALNSLMMLRFQQSQQETDEKEDDSKTDKEPFINAVFSAMCDSINYAQVSLADVKECELLAGGALMDKKEGILQFKVLCRILPNCRRFFVCLRGLDADESSRVLFSKKFTKFLSKIGDDATSKLEAITFGMEADAKLTANLSKFEDTKWIATAEAVGEECFVKFQKSSGK